MKTVIVGVDASDRAPHVLQTAMDIARSRGAQLLVLRAVGVPVEFPVEALSTAPDALPALLLNATQHTIDRFLADHGKVSDKVSVRAEARLGTPWQVICEAAKELDAEMIVIGSHGYGLIDRLLGTTAARVVNHAPCSVLVVRDGAAPAKETK